MYLTVSKSMLSPSPRVRQDRRKMQMLAICCGARRGVVGGGGDTKLRVLGERETKSNCCYDCAGKRECSSSSSTSTSAKQMKAAGQAAAAGAVVMTPSCVCNNTTPTGTDRTGSTDSSGRQHRQAGTNARTHARDSPACRRAKSRSAR